MENDEINEVREAAVKYGRFMSPERFLDWEEEQQEEKHEYVEGSVIAMSGASANHNFIQANLIGHIWPKLDRKSCKITPSEMKVSVRARQSFFYPDAIIICGKPEFEDERQRALKNPMVLFEILSPSTENYDLGKKFFFYIQVESVREIIFISSTSVEVKAGRRQPDDSWKFETLTDLFSSLSIESVGVTLPLTAIYDEIKF